MLEGHSGPVRGLAYSADGTVLASASTDGTARIWSYTADRLQRAIGSMTKACLDVRFRENYLGETPRQARRAYERCERSHGRVP